MTVFNLYIFTQYATKDKGLWHIDILRSSVCVTPTTTDKCLFAINRCIAVSLVSSKAKKLKTC